MSFDERQALIQTYRCDLPGQDGEVREAWLAQRQEMHRAGSMMGEFRHVNGNIFRISERATRDGGPVTLSSDITEIKQAEARPLDAIASNRDGFALCDAEERLITNNPDRNRAA